MGYRWPRALSLARTHVSCLPPPCRRQTDVSPRYYRGAAAAIVVYDITSSESFSRAKNWVRELQRAGNPNNVIALAGNKYDLQSTKRKVEFEDAKTYAEENGAFQP